MTAEPSAAWSDLTLSVTTGLRCLPSTRPVVGWVWLLLEEWSMPLEVKPETSTYFGNTRNANGNVNVKEVSVI